MVEIYFLSWFFIINNIVEELYSDGVIKSIIKIYDVLSYNN